jgi:hypothetical protein
MRLLPLSLALLLLSGSAHAESLVSTRSGTWRGFGDGTVVWAGGTPSPDDDFTIAAGHRVTIDNFVALTTGSVTVANGGSLTIEAGARLTPGDRLVVQSGARYQQQGRVLATCTIVSEPNWNGTNPIVPLSCSTEDIVAGQHSLVFLAQDPKNGDWTGRSVFIGPGGKKGAALNRYAWYEIVAADIAAITYDLDSGSYAGEPGAPYQGTRGNPTSAPIPAAQLDFAGQPGGRATRVDIAAAYGSVVAMHADLGSHYLYFTEDAANAADPTRCSGLTAKILHSEDGGVSADRLYVAGDVTGCTHPSLTARIIPGARRGDRIALVSSAQLNGSIGGQNVSHVRFESGAELRVRWARFARLGAMAAGEASPPLRRSCNVCFLQSSSAPAAAFEGWFEDVEIAFVEAVGGAGQETAALHFDSFDASSPPDYRFPSVGLLDLGRFRIGRLHIHDGRNEATGAGGQGIHVDAAKNLVIDGARIERMSGDLFAASVGGNETGSASDVNSIDVRRMLLYEGAAEHDNAQQCFEPTIVFGDGPTATGQHNYLRQHGAFRARDVLAVGCYREPVRVIGNGVAVERLVVGGRLEGPTSRPFLFFKEDGSFVHESLNRVVDSILTTYGGDGAGAVLSPFLYASLEDSVLFGDEQSADADNVHEGFQQCVRSFWYHEGSTGFALDGNADMNNVFDSVRSWTDCAVLSATADRLAENFWVHPRPQTFLQFERFQYLQTAPWRFGDGPFGRIWDNVHLVERAVFLSTESPGTQGFWSLPVDPSSQICFESLNTPEFEFATGVSSTTLTVPSLTPDVSDLPTVGSLIGDPESADVCERTKPAELGLAGVGTAHVLLGDFAVGRLHPTYTSRERLLKTAGQPLPE